MEKYTTEQLRVIRGKSIEQRQKICKEISEIGRELGCDRIEFNCWMFNTNALAAYDHMGFKHQRIQYEMKL